MTHLFLHGLGQTPNTWTNILSGISVTDACCPDLFSLCADKPLNFAGIYRGFCQLSERASAPLHLCGLSLGGMLALRYAAEHPEKVGSLVLIGTQYQSPDRLLTIQNMIFRLMPQKAFAQMGLGKQDFLSLCLSMKGLNFEPELSKITCPVLVLCGEKDRANLPAARQLAALLPHAEFSPIPHAGHEANTDASGELTALLRAFYQKHDIA